MPLFLKFNRITGNKRDWNMRKSGKLFVVRLQPLPTWIGAVISPSRFAFELTRYANDAPHKRRFVEGGVRRPGAGE